MLFHGVRGHYTRQFERHRATGTRTIGIWGENVGSDVISDEIRGTG